MTRLRLDWPIWFSGGYLAALPVMVSFEGSDLVVPTGQYVEVGKSRVIYLTIDVPGGPTIRGPFELPRGEDLSVDLAKFVGSDGMELLEHGGVVGPIKRARRGAGRDTIVDVRGGLDRLPPSASFYAAQSATFSGLRDDVLVSADLPVSISARVATRWTPDRVVSIPFAGIGANACRIASAHPTGAAERIRVEPREAPALALMDLLLMGDYRRAAVAAQTLTTLRAESDPRAWSAESFPQLLIGYAFALSRSTSLLAAWCRRTRAERDMGTDGLILEAALAHQQLDSDRAFDLLADASDRPLPTTMHGVNLGLKLAAQLLSPTSNVLTDSPAASIRTASEALVRLRDRYLYILVVADGESSSLSIPIKRDQPLSVRDMAWSDRAIWFMRWIVSRYRNRYSLGDSGRTKSRQYLIEGAAMSGPTTDPQSTVDDGNSAQTSQTQAQSKPLTGVALWVAVAAVAVWVVFTAVLAAKTGSDEVVWTRLAWVFGSVEAVAFAAAGALFGTAVQRQNVDKAEQRADAAQKDADSRRDEATKGRALAAAIQADAVSGASETDLQAMDAGSGGATSDTQTRHAQLARSLFGDLI